MLTTCTCNKKKQCRNIILLNCQNCAAPQLCQCQRPEAQMRVSMIWKGFIDGNEGKSLIFDND